MAQDVFLFLGEKRKNGDVVEATVQVSYMELYREELRDLLELHTIHKELHIRDDERGNTGNSNLNGKQMWHSFLHIFPLFPNKGDISLIH